MAYVQENVRGAGRHTITVIEGVTPDGFSRGLNLVRRIAQNSALIFYKKMREMNK